MLVDTETGPGVYETALAYTEARRMADNAVLFKLLAKSVGIKYGIMPTFMAKPWADVSMLSFFAISTAAYWSSFHAALLDQLPGCSGHIHVSLKDPKTGKNVFAITEEEAKAGGRKDALFEDTKYLSQIGEWFLAGIMTGLPDSKRVYAYSSAYLGS
jgi:glutamine synthetase